MGSINAVTGFLQPIKILQPLTAISNIRFDVTKTLEVIIVSQFFNRRNRVRDKGHPYYMDIIWMQSQFQKRLNMLAISSNRDQICLQCLKSSQSHEIVSKPSNQSSFAKITKSKLSN